MSTDKTENLEIAGSGKIPVKRFVIHFGRKFFGFLLYHSVANLPLNFWGEKGGIFWWSLPFIGYYAYGE